jgi:dihydrofolate synthase / folylpolyglutamate synthase
MTDSVDPMNYEQATQFLESRIALGWKLGLESMQEMLAELGNHQQTLRYIHIAGTNGKGSVAAMLESVFRAAGYRTGLYTSPHLVDVRERIRLNGQMISKRQLAVAIERIQQVVEKFQATYFETLTAAALLFFADQQADIVCLEVGLGGRLDATNVIVPDVSIITSISYDHTEHLGGTLAEIAAEKAGIIKTGVPCIVGDLPSEASEVIEQKCCDQRAPLITASQEFSASIRRQVPGRMTLDIEGASPFAGSVQLALNGRHQAKNAEIVASACEKLRKSGWRLSSDDFQKGMRKTRWPGRFEIIHRHPTVIVDVAHNAASIAELAALLLNFYAHWKIIIVIGLLKDKDVLTISRQIAGIAHAVQPVEARSPRALSAVELMQHFSALHAMVLPPGTVAEGVEAVWRMADEQTLICITGSHFVVGEALQKIKGLTK